MLCIKIVIQIFPTQLLNINRREEKLMEMQMAGQKTSKDKCRLHIIWFSILTTYINNAPLRNSFHWSPVEFVFFSLNVPYLCTIMYACLHLPFAFWHLLVPALLSPLPLTGFLYFHNPWSIDWIDIIVSTISLCIYYLVYSYFIHSRTLLYIHQCLNWQIKLSLQT